MQIIKFGISLYRDKICVYNEHPIAGRDMQPFDEINKVMCNM